MGAVGLLGSANAESAPDATAAKSLATPTHHQTGLIQGKVDGMPERQLKCFCLTPDDRIVAGFAGDEGELRVFDEQGKFVESWPAPFEPDAIHVRADGTIFLAGEGRLARLSPAGKVELESKAPHAGSMAENLDKIRDDVIAQNKRRSEMYVDQVKQYEDLIAQADTRAEEIKKELAEIDADDADPELWTAEKRQLEGQLATQKQMKSQYEQIKTQFDELAAQNKPKELTEDEIDNLVKAAVAYKTQASSISATDANVYLATRSAVGHGFEVWKMDADFTGGEQIISGLSGCCGQMDVKANANGLFVAENSKHRVCCYDQEGKLVRTWGKGARTGVEGFGSCCNPMNGAFGPGGVVYTAEDSTGRIKRYSPEGELLGLVGSVDLVPGCKNCSIAVSDDGSRVYMLDITRGHIVKMEPYGPGEAPQPEAETEEPPVDVFSFGGSKGEAPNAGGTVAKGLLKILGY
jgi:hypothetical protein